MTSVEFVEKALIGSLLNDPSRRAEVIWLHVEDFTNPLCRAVWRHLESGNPPHCQPPTDLVEMSDVLGLDYDLHPRLRSPAELATLQVQAPEKPAVLEYGRILVESRIRREVAAMGLRLESLATGEPEQIIGEAAHALASLEGLDQRWQVSMGQRREVDPDLISAWPSVRAVEPSLLAGVGAETWAAGSAVDEHLAVSAVIGAAIHDWPPGARARVLQTVRKSDFTDEPAAATWQAVEDLAEHGAPIDEITVSWQGMRARNLSSDGPTVPALRATRDAALFHESGAATLVRSTLIRVTSRADAAMLRIAADLGVDIATVVDSAATHLAAVTAAAQRLSGDFCSNESLTSIKKRLLDRTRRPSVASDTARAICQRPSSYPVDLSRWQVSP